MRLELARARGHEIRVIPVLVGGTRLPQAAELPDDLQGPTQRQAVELHDETWHHDINGLVRSLRGEPAVPATGRRRWLVAGTALIVLLALGAGAWWLWGPGTGAQTGSATAAPPSCARPADQAWSRMALSKDPTAVDKADPNYPRKVSVKKAYWRAHDGKWQVILATSVENTGSRTEDIGDYEYKHLVVAQRPFPVMCFSHTDEPLEPGIIEDDLVGFNVSCKPTGYIQLMLESGRISVTPDTLEPGSC